MLVLKVTLAINVLQRGQNKCHTSHESFLKNIQIECSSIYCIRLEKFQEENWLQFEQQGLVNSTGEVYTTYMHASNEKFDAFILDVL